MGKLNKILKLVSSDSAKIKQLSKTFKNSSSINSNPTTKETHKSLNFDIQKIFLLLFVFYFFFYFYKYNFSFSNILSQIDSLLLNLFSLINYQQVIGLNGISILSLLITTFLFILFLTSIFGMFIAEDLKSLIQKESRYFSFALLITLVVFTGWNALWVNSISDIPIADQTNYVLNKSISNGQSILERIACSLDTVCIQSKLNSNTAKTSTITSYGLNFNSRTEFYGQDISYPDLKNSIQLNYEITSSGELQLNKMECYLDKISDKTLFYSKDLNLNIPTTNGNALPLDNLECDNIQKAILNTHKTDLNQEKHSILIKTYFNFKTKYSQTIPIVDYKQLLIEENLDPNKKYSQFKLKNKLNKLTSNLKTFIQSNDALKVDDNIIVKKLPLLVGDNNDKQISFPLIITVDNGGDFGKFTTGEITNIDLPSSLNFLNNAQDYKKIIKISNDKFVQTINLKENEGGFNTNNKLISTQDLNIYIQSNFEKIDTIKFNVIDFPIQNITQINKTIPVVK